MKKILEELKGKGIVPTAQRLEILKIIKCKKEHLTAEEIYKVVKKKFPTMSFATVYNTLQKFVELGEIQSLSIKKDKACYDWETAYHHHFYCNSCNKIYDLGIECEVAKRGVIDGHKINGVQAYFYGVCNNCKIPPTLLKKLK